MSTADLLTHDGTGPAAPDDADPVLEGLDQADAAYRAARARWARDLRDAQQACADLAAVEAARRAAEDEVRQPRAEAEVVLHHHERYDGAGYPDGLKGDRIPLAARVVGVVDAYSAMTARRSYKESMDPAVARAELVRCKGTHFDPKVVDAFLAVLDEPDAAADCPDDGCGLIPGATAEHDFRHVVRTPAAIPVPPPRRT